VEAAAVFTSFATLLFNVPIQVAVATSLASIIPTTIFGAYAHHKQGNVNVPKVDFRYNRNIRHIDGVYFSTLIPSFILSKLLEYLQYS